MWNFDGYNGGHSATVWLLYCFNALKAFWIFQKVFIRKGEQKSLIQSFRLFLIILFMAILFLTITSLNWKAETAAVNPNSKNWSPCTLAVKMDPLVLYLATKLVIQQSPPIANFWWEQLLYFGVSLWCSEIMCGFIFFRWLAMPLKWPLHSVALSATVCHL